MKRCRTNRVACRDLGVMDYKACWELQQQLFDALLARKRRGAELSGAEQSGAEQPGTEQPASRSGQPGVHPEPAGPDRTHTPDIPASDAGTVLLVEHPPVYTLGKSGHAENLLVSREALEGLGATFFHIDRGGDITFHGPGQLVCYPILDLERLGIGLREYIASLEEAVIRTVAEYGIAAHWKYKTGSGEGTKAGDEEKFAWIRRLLETQQESDAQDFFHNLKVDMFADEVFVFSPKGDVINLPAGATPATAWSAQRSTAAS